MEWTCSSTSSLTIVNGISATAGQEDLGGPAVGEECNRQLAQQELGLPQCEQGLGFSLHLSPHPEPSQSLCRGWLLGSKILEGGTPGWLRQLLISGL